MAEFESPDAVDPLLISPPPPPSPPYIPSPPLQRPTETRRAPTVDQSVDSGVGLSYRPPSVPEQFKDREQSSFSKPEPEDPEKEIVVETVEEHETDHDTKSMPTIESSITTTIEPSKDATVTSNVSLETTVSPKKSDRLRRRRERQERTREHRMSEVSVSPERRERSQVRSQTTPLTSEELRKEKLLEQERLRNFAAISQEALRAKTKTPTPPTTLLESSLDDIEPAAPPASSPRGRKKDRKVRLLKSDETLLKSADLTGEPSVSLSDEKSASSDDLLRADHSSLNGSNTKRLAGDAALPVPKTAPEVVAQSQPQLPVPVASKSGTEIVTRITRTTHPERVTTDESGHVTLVKQKRSKVMLEQELQSGDGIYDTSGCRINANVTIDGPTVETVPADAKQKPNVVIRELKDDGSFKTPSQSMDQLDGVDKSSHSKARRGSDSAEAGGGSKRRRTKSEVKENSRSMDNLLGKVLKPLKGDKRRSSTTSSVDIGALDGVKRRPANGEMLTDTKFERFKPTVRGREGETSWEYSMECNCVNGVNATVR